MSWSTELGDIFGVLFLEREMGIMRARRYGLGNACTAGKFQDCTNRRGPFVVGHLKFVELNCG